jgi:hypothetical protein
LNTALDEEYLTDKNYTALRELLEETWKVLNGYIAYLQKCATSGVPQHSDGSATDNQTTINCGKS